jgi:hypothetical protein
MVSSSFLSPPLLSALALRDCFRETRSAMSTLASVVSLGSPGSMPACVSLARCRLLGGFPLAESDFLCVEDWG